MRSSLSQELFESLTKNQDRVSLISKGVPYTYQELLANIGVWEKLFQEREMASGSYIGFCMPKGFQLVSAVLACIKQGHTYIPLDVKSPVNRLESMVGLAQMDLVILHSDISDFSLPDYAQQKGDYPMSMKVFRYTGQPLERKDIPMTILFTSGSTGNPKGVMLSETNVAAFVNWAKAEIGLHKEDIVASIAPFHFDLSTFDLFATLLAGGTVVLFDQKEIRNPRWLTQTLRENEVSVVYTTPTILRLMCGFGKWDGNKYGALRSLIFAGEVMPLELLSQLVEMWPQVSMYNWYGPTETNVVTSYKIAKVRSLPNEVPIGFSCPYALCKVQRNGVKHTSGDGELHVCGESVALGYVGEEKGGRFYIEDDQIWYNTGDFVHIDEDGLMWFKGRADRMIKRNGIRMELGEVEVKARLFDGVEQAVCIARKGEHTSLILVVRHRENAPIDDMVLRSFLASHLPPFMLPDHIFAVDEIPITSNHKVDFKALEKLLDDRA